jgi:hypothetical protein
MDYNLLNLTLTLPKFVRGVSHIDAHFEKLLKLDYNRGLGFLTDLTKDGSVNLDFLKHNSELPIYVFEETFRKSWKVLNNYRGGSQDWCRVLHPLGFILEIQMTNFIEILKNDTCINGELQGFYRFHKNQLIRE